jgi:hypothetical protein
MKNFIKILLLLFLGSYFTFSQVLQNYESGFKTLFDKKGKVNPYYFGYNPAWLSNEVSDEYLELKSGVNDETGDFKKFTDPGDIRNYLFTATGKKRIDSSQTFRGSFGFQRTEYNNWQWLFTRDYATGSPFLIGDSTTGNTRLNGIVMSAEYSAKVFDNFDLGFSLNYNVNQGLKMAHPRPTSNDREVNFNSGLAYHIEDNMSVGIRASVYDNVEHINYSQDPGALTTEIVLLKFRGYDFPNVFRMATESRHTFNNGYSAGLNFLYNQSPLTLTAFADAGFNKINVKDGGSNPISEGFWQNNQYHSGIVSLFELNNSAFISLLYTFNSGNDWAKFPAYDVKYDENNWNEHSIISGLEYSFSENISGGLEAGLKLIDYHFNDYYSNIYSKSKVINYMLNLGFKIKWFDKLSSFVSAGFNMADIGNNDIVSALQSRYFTDFRRKDVNFYQTGFNSYLFNLVTAYSPGFGGELLVNLSFINSIPGSTSDFAGQNRTNSNITLEYRVAAY